MPSQKCITKSLRLLTALAALCYFWVSAALSFQHTDCLTHDLEAYLRLPMTVSAAQSAPLPLHTQIAAHKHLAAHSQHCAACEWQANNLSPALPAFAFAFVPMPHTRVITTFPRYLRLLEFPTASRAPPLA